ncbi:hypothetical protein ColTof4_02964 [Colletotrichum tofieldiae]|nr:hypothetical protein ColTof3_13631 [Colletotrichum tofieldiae]GKT70541.1 hypothetical protein ColTof4_02964 [Colletotrichum tofieldiae]
MTMHEIGKGVVWINFACPSSSAISCMKVSRIPKESRKRLDDQEAEENSKHMDWTIPKQLDAAVIP